MKIKSNLMIVAIAITIIASSCVGTRRYRSLQADYSNLQGRLNSVSGENATCQSNLSAANVQIAGLQDQLRSERANSQNLQNNAQSLQEALHKCLTTTTQGNINVATLLDEINAANRYIQQLVDSRRRSDSLNMVLTNNLTRSLTRDEMRNIDIQVLKGVVYISLSDQMLYRSGSFQITPEASETLSKIAKIILDYKDFDVVVEGNTDDVPISQTNIRNNWDLSVLRGSSVVQALQKDFNIDPIRLTAAGRGEYNPIATNATEAGRARNRRTQIILRPKLDQFLELLDKAPRPDPSSTSAN